jgi:hypothetical protein
MAVHKTPRAVTQPAKGNAANTGAPGPTPAPVTSVSLALARDKSWGRESYGAGGYGGRVVADPGQTVTSPLADAIRKAQADEADVLSAAIKGGTPASIADQLRTVSAKPYPPTHGAKSNQDASKVYGKASLPASTTDGEKEPVRKPA